jgi:Rrf2 family protein
MDVIRRNTDYALRAMVHLGRHYGQDALSARQIAEDQNFSYTLASKLMQRLQKAGLVESIMGAKGGFRLSRDPSQINLQEVIETIQGPIRLSTCLLGVKTCCKYGTCPIRKKLGGLQQEISDFLTGTTLGELLKMRPES